MTTTIHRPATGVAAGASLLASVLLSGCGMASFLGPTPPADWEEVSDFELQPGDMTGREAEEFLADRVAIEDGEITPGSASHLASVDGPAGTVRFLTYRTATPDRPGQTILCSTMIGLTSMSAACGPELDRPTQAVEVAGESWTEGWRAAELRVQGDVARMEATAVDGTVYTVTPLNGLGYLEWPDERGSVELVAYDADGAELGRALAGLDR